MLFACCCGSEIWRLGGGLVIIGFTWREMRLEKKSERTEEVSEFCLVILVVRGEGESYEKEDVHWVRITRRNQDYRPYAEC